MNGRELRFVMAMLLLTTTVAAQETRSFRTVMEIPVTSVKNQYRSGTCWDYATLGYFESEILRKTGKTYDLCEMFVVNKDYMALNTTYIFLNRHALGFAL